MKFSVSPSQVSGKVEAPPSKSYTHRAFLAGALSDRMEVKNPLISADTKATMECAEGIGAKIRGKENSFVVDGVDGGPETPEDVLDCANSGTTLRLFTGASSLTDGISVLTGDSSLRDRPNGPLLESLNDLGASARSTRGNGQAPLVIEGSLEGGETRIDGTVSSQFISSLLFTTPLTDEGATIEIENELKSRPYVDITLEVLEKTGVEVMENDGAFVVKGDQSYDANEFRVPGDFSSASYPLAAGAVAGEIEVKNLYPSAQGDSRIVEVIDDMGAKVEWNQDEGYVKVENDDLEGVEFDASDNPDLVPTVAVLGSVAEGETRIFDAEHLRYKETDRLEAITTELSKMGAEIEEGHDNLMIDGDSSDLKGGEVSGRHDHRIVMALAVAGLVAEGKTVIDTAESVGISYPKFAEEMSSAGMNIEKIE